MSGLSDSQTESLDLLSAALNQSGLMDYDVDPAEHNESLSKNDCFQDPLLQALQNTHVEGIKDKQQEKKTDDATAGSNDKSRVTMIKSIKSTVLNSPTSQPVKAVVLNKSGCKVTTIPNAKIIKLPTLKAGSIVKINKLGKANVILPKVQSAGSLPISKTSSQIFAPLSDNKQVSTASSSMKSDMFVHANTVTTNHTSSDSTPHFNSMPAMRPLSNSNSIECSAQRPLSPAIQTVVKTIPKAVIKSVARNATSVSLLKSTLQSTSGGKIIKLTTPQQKILSTRSTVAPSGSTPGVRLALKSDRGKTAESKPSTKLNLGSMFVESAEKAVDSDYDTPPGSPYQLIISETHDDGEGQVESDGDLYHQVPTIPSKVKPLNGKVRLFNNIKLSSSKSIPTIKLSLGNDRTSLDKRKAVGEHTFFRTLSMPLVQIQDQPGEELVAEDEKEEESEIQHAQTYAEYMPSKLRIGLPHPDSVVETSSLASINPPNVRYFLNIPKQTIDLCQLSALQLESVVYACQKHQTFLPSGERAGYLIGDGAGVGKGRSVAGIIYENYLVGRKRALWFSVSNDLKYDAERDLRDIGAKHIKVYSLNKFKYGKITGKNNGAVKKGVIFATYSSLIGESQSSHAKYHTRLKQILHWCGEDFDGPIIFDECHKAKNLVPSGAGKSTKTGITVLELQKKLPYARVVYASATGATEPRNMAYMSRLGLWGPGTPFLEFLDFIQAVERRGVGAMEMVAMDMKLRGSYIARQLSFYGVSFKIDEVTLEPSFVSMYNKAVRLWVTAREAFQAAASMMEAEYFMKKTMWAQFWSAHQRFFKYLCISAKVKHTVALVREAVKHGKCVVIGLQSTGEAGTLNQLEKCGGELEDFVSTAKTVLENLIVKHFPAPDRKRVTQLFGEDFYKARDIHHERKAAEKRKLVSNGNLSPASKKPRRDSESDKDEASSTSGSADEDLSDVASSDDNFSDHSAVSDEDIGKIFGDGSDSDENESPLKQKKNKKRKRSKSSSSSGQEEKEEEEDYGLNLEEMKRMKEKEEKPATGLLNSLDLVSGTLTSSLPGMGPVERAQALKRELLDRLESLGPSLPNNMLDELIDALGGTENVAEMTGRKGRVIATDEGNVEYQTRTEEDVPVEMLNMKEKQRFMDGEKNIAIISEAASSGISLQADKRARNQRRRVHVTLELPWSADRAIQQFGRTHRSNQVNAPEYVFLITELAGEQRFASVVAKRLESLGALTHGDRRATASRDLSKYNYDNKYGRKALDCVMKSIAGYDQPIVPPPSSYRGNFFEHIRHGLLGVGLITRETGQRTFQLDKDYCNIFKFMNRILGMEVEEQNALFAFFADTLKAIIQEAKRLGEYDQGIMDIGAGSNTVERVKCREFPILSGGSATLHTVRVERGSAWDEAEKLFRENAVGEDSGFYITFHKRNGKHMVMLAIESTSRRHRGPPTFLIYRPNTGKQIRKETLHEIEKKYKKAEASQVQELWEEHYQASLDQCSHQFWQGSCTRGGPASCHVGKRRRTYHLLSGSVLSVWRIVEDVLSRDGGSKYKMQVVRLKTSEGGKLVGLLIPSICLASLITALSNQSDEDDLYRSTTSYSNCNVLDDVNSDESDDYEEVDEVDPDAMCSSVLFSKHEFPWSR